MPMSDEPKEAKPLQSLREALDRLPPDAEIVVEDRHGVRYQLASVDAWGTRTDEPFLRILVGPDWCDTCTGGPEDAPCSHSILRW